MNWTTSPPGAKFAGIRTDIQSNRAIDRFNRSFDGRASAGWKDLESAMLAAP
jgi:hypothetical protein